MMLRLSIIFSLSFVACAARAEDNANDIVKAFSEICSAVMDEKPNVEAIATAHGMGGMGGLSAGTTMKVGKIELGGFQPTRNKHNIMIVTTTYSDAREVECKSVGPTPIARGELDQLVADLKLDGQFFSASPNLTTGYWKRHGVKPLVLVTINSTPTSTVLIMQRVDFSVGGLNSNRDTPARARTQH